SRESASFACAIPASFVLSCNLPMTNARAAWLRFGAFQSPRFSSLQFHWPLFSCHSLYSPLPPDPLTTGDRPLFSLIMRPPSYRQRLFVDTTSVDRRGPPSMPRAELGIHGLNRWTVKC